MHVNIRIRVITEKLGRKYYKSKGVIVDVTPKGATVRMDDGSLLDRVPERYLETALPKTGGRVLVLAGKHKLVKGQLLERDSKKGRGVVQVYEDMNVLTLSLDDMAEWCGPLDDDDHGHH
jgi:G patch domain/KOW motif-containing protein